MSRMFTLYELYETLCLMIVTNILQMHKASIETVEAKLLFGQKLWGIDSWFSLSMLTCQQLKAPQRDSARFSPRVGPTYPTQPLL